MTKEEYLKLKETPFEKWTYAQCKEADLLVKPHTLKNVKRILKARGVDDKTVEFISLMSSCYFGSVEVDNYMTYLKAYPDWM